MMVFTVFTLVGIFLFINKHRGWGTLCFAIALVSLLAML
jgi:Gpi18-like mannosyltransferase